MEKLWEGGEYLENPWQRAYQPNPFDDERRRESQSSSIDHRLPSSGRQGWRARWGGLKTEDGEHRAEDGQHETWKLEKEMFRG